jgi:hypothetical protein
LYAGKRLKDRWGGVGSRACDIGMVWIWGVESSEFNFMALSHELTLRIVVTDTKAPRLREVESKGSLGFNVGSRMY